MYAWIIYDIHKNKTRLRVAKRCKYYGLARVQKSVFLGPLKRKWLKRVFADLSALINHRTDRLFVVPMNEGSFQAIGQAGAPPFLAQSMRVLKVRII